MYTITYGSRRDKGLVRQENQDQIISFDSSVFGQVFLLADGMGGHEGGAIAANMAITGFKQHFQTLSTKLPLRESLVEAARLTNLDIYEKGNEKDGGSSNSLRMGSTLVLCVLSGGRYIVAHAGDSRCYVFSNGILNRLTKDHTAVQKMVDAGILSPEDAKNHPDASVLTRAFGQRPAIELDISEPQSLAVDETLLLCSDGLYGYVEEAAIVAQLRQHHDPQAAADALLQLALDAGGHDNVSIFVIRAEPSSTKAVTAPDPPVEKAAFPPTPQAAAAPVPAATAPRSRLRLAWWLIGIAAVIAAGPVAAFLKPDIIPLSLREKLAAWGVPLPPPEDQAAALSASPRDQSPVPEKPVPVMDPAAAGNSASPAQPTRLSVEGTPAAAGSVGANSLGANSETSPPASQPPAAAAPEAVPVTAPSGRALVVVAFPPNSNAVFMNEVHDFVAKIHTAGFQVTEMPKQIEPNSVWRTVTANPAGFAPDRLFLSAVFLPGFEQDAARICRVVPCSQPGVPLPAGDLWMFQENFGKGGVALFAHPAAAAPPVTVPGPPAPAGAHAGSSAANPRE